MPIPPPTTRQISVACGYSPAAVSHALRDSPKVSAATRKKIQSIARKMGWKPNPFASAYMAHLRAGRPSTYQASLAFLLPGPEGGRLRDQLMHIQRHFAGAEKRATSLGYELQTIWLHEPHLTARRLNTILSSRNIPGIMMSGSSILTDFDLSQFASVSMGFAPAHSDICRVTVDTGDGFTMALRRTRELGYRRIAVVASDEYDNLVNYGTFRAAGYLREEWATEGADCEILICHFKTSGTHEVAGVAAWLQNHRPDAVLGENVAWRAIHQLGWRVPQDIAFVSTDWSPDYPLIGGFDQRHELHGAIAVETVVGQINHNERGLPEVPRVILIPGGWKDALSIPARADIPKITDVAHL